MKQHPRHAFSDDVVHVGWVDVAIENLVEKIIDDVVVAVVCSVDAEVRREGTQDPVDAVTQLFQFVKM